MVKNVLIVLLFFTFNSILFSQKENELILKNKKELEEINKQLKNLDTKLNEIKTKQSEAIKAIDIYDEQERLLRKSIGSIAREEKVIGQEILDKNAQLILLQNEIQKLKNEYSKYIISIYKHLKTNDLELMITSRSLNEALLRYKYLEMFSKDRLKTVKLLETKKKEINNLKTKLQNALVYKEEVKNIKINEEKNLQRKLNEKRIYVSEIRKNRDALVKDIESKRASANKLSSMISSLIVKEKEKREKIKRQQSETTKQKNVVVEEFENDNFGTFSKLKGRMSWPVSRGRILNKFGENKNEQLNTITLNFGIDIGVPYGSQVRAVSDGEVSIISWLPGYGNIVIVRHSESYRTVYANLSSLNVQENQKLSAGDVIGASGESITGEMLHFEIWKDRDKQNPELWLSRRN